MSSVELTEKMYLLAIEAVKSGMSCAEASIKYSIDQAVLACRVYA